jgi:hypothetical protein
MWGTERKKHCCLNALCSEASNHSLFFLLDFAVPGLASSNIDLALQLAVEVAVEVPVQVHVQNGSYRS